MCYTEEQIERYLEILNNYNNVSGDSANQAVGEEIRRVGCWQCQSDCFFASSGYNICDSCGASNGHTLGYYDQKDSGSISFSKEEYLSEKVSL